MRVVDSRRQETYIQRVRECECGSRCTTAEIILPQRGKQIKTQLDTLFMRRALTAVLGKVDNLKKSSIEEISVGDGVSKNDT